jgi:hypothetical protein
MTTLLDKETVKEVLRELMQSEPEFFYELFLGIDIDLKKLKQQRLEAIVKEDFKEYESVFKALA